MGVVCGKPLAAEVKADHTHRVVKSDDAGAGIPPEGSGIVIERPPHHVPWGSDRLRNPARGYIFPAVIVSEKLRQAVNDFDIVVARVGDGQRSAAPDSR